jgi:cysteine synthase A
VERDATEQALNRFIELTPKRHDDAGCEVSLGRRSVFFRSGQVHDFEKRDIARRAGQAVTAARSAGAVEEATAREFLQEGLETPALRIQMSGDVGCAHRRAAAAVKGDIEDDGDGEHGAVTLNERHALDSLAPVGLSLFLLIICVKLVNLSMPAAPSVPFTLPQPRARGRIYGSILETIGATPLVRLPRLSSAEALTADLTVKLEFFNPLASVKDRIALAMIEDAEARGVIAPERSVLVEPTSGNTGIGLAFVAAAKGYRLIVTMPEGASIERRKMMRLLGAELVLTPAAEGMRGAIREAEKILASTPGAWMPRQFDNPANPAIHAVSTAEEIWMDTEGAVDIVVGGAGTGGTMTGIASVLKPRKPGLAAYVVEPAESAVLSGDPPGPHGIQGIGPGFKPSILDLSVMDGVLQVSEREAMAMARRVAALDGVPVGISSGAAIAAAVSLAKRPENRGKLIVAIAPSFAERYFSTPLFAGLG